jgi:ribosomal protein S18 acetylase RimI-like enzyme
MDAVREIFREYAELVGNAICFGSFQKELEGLPGAYAAPSGGLFVADGEGELAGCVAFRTLGDGAAEMKRLYVRAAYRGSGLGRELAQRVMEEARAAGHSVLRLDTLPHLSGAIAMYRAFGFREIPPYGNNPAGALCFELLLG